jgi:hypothetical protein
VLVDEGTDRVSQQLVVLVVERPSHRDHTGHPDSNPGLVSSM